MSWICNSCSTENRDTARLCALCGTPKPSVQGQNGNGAQAADRGRMIWRCPECGSTLTPDSDGRFPDFCPSCGAFLDGDSLTPEAEQTAPREAAPPQKQPRLFLREVESFYHQPTFLCYQTLRVPNYLTESIELEDGAAFGLPCLPERRRYRVISEKHCLFTCEDGVWYLTNLKNTNGTRFNGRKLGEGQKTAICSTDQVQFGNLLFHFFLEEP